MGIRSRTKWEARAVAVGLARNAREVRQVSGEMRRHRHRNGRRVPMVRYRDRDRPVTVIWKVGP
jgi:hypothetical protein